LPQLPRLVHKVLADRHDGSRAMNEAVMQMLLVEQRRTNRLLQALLLFGVAVGVGAVVARFWLVLAYGA
jgi:ubiquinone biosynthesis protein